MIASVDDLMVMTYEEIYDYMTYQINVVKEANKAREVASGIMARKMIMDDLKDIEVRNRHVKRHESKKMSLPDTAVLDDLCENLIPNIDSIELMNYLDFTLTGFNKMMGKYPEYSDKLRAKFPQIQINAGQDRVCVMRYNMISKARKEQE